MTEEITFEYYDKCMKGYENYDSFSDEDKRFLYKIVIDELIAAGY